ncbi:MAG: type I pullulanase [Eubacteriales bacterium]|nr:type I pullulanase [Eubacteriales bacterium]
MRDMTGKRTPLQWKELFESEQFAQEYFYEGDDLGAAYEPEQTVFKVWAPTAERVELKLYKTGSDQEPGSGILRQMPMARGEKGVWQAAVKGDMAGVYYTYLVTADKETKECADIYGRACGVNGQRSMVADLAATNPDGWEQEHVALQTEKNPKSPVIYEVHVKDFSNDGHSGVPSGYRGKFKAFTCMQTGLDGDLSKPTCVAYLKKLGITHVHLLPMYDYGSVDEADSAEQFNWGYDPVNYNVPEGSYSTDPFHGEVRIRECKEMIQALHSAGIRVVMDVVYNHTYSPDSWFQRTVPYYYYRLNEDGSFSNGSVCSNDTASERPMYRKFMTDSVVYWAKEYHLDGFRFDLMGLHDTETMNAIRKALNELPYGEQILMYGEPWAGGPTAMASGFQQAVKANVELLDEKIAIFNDDTRDSIKGSVFFAGEPGFVNGKEGMEDKIRSSVLAWCDQKGGYRPHGPGQVISYVSAHDNYTLWDKLCLTKCGEPDFRKRDEAVLVQNRLAAGIYFTCLGIPFFQAGEEGARTKLGISDSYCSSAGINQLDWTRIYEYNDLVEYYAGLIALHQDFSIWKNDGMEALDRIRFLDAPKGTVAFCLAGTAADKWKELAVIYNAGRENADIGLPEGCWRMITEGAGFTRDRNGGLQAAGEIREKVRAAAMSVTILGR